MNNGVGIERRTVGADEPWFDLPSPAYERRAAGLANQPDILEAAASYRDNGYLIRDFGFAEAVLEEAAELTRAQQGQSRRIQDAWLTNRAVRKLATDSRVIDFLSRLYGRQAFPFQTLNMAVGSQQAIHSDTFHFNARPEGFMCGVWVALEDIHPGSGPLEFYPGSQKLPVYAASDVTGDYQTSYVGLIAATLETSGLKAETAPIRRGQAFIWAANLFHGGAAITDSTRTRLSQVTHYYFRGCSYFTPMASGEKVFWREPYDIAAGAFVANAGRAERPGLKYRLGERLKVWGRKPFAS